MAKKISKRITCKDCGKPFFPDKKENFCVLCSSKHENKFIQIREANEWEGETWYHLVKVNGNERAITKIKSLIKKFGPSYGMSYLETYFPESMVNKLMPINDTGYMNKYGKNLKKITLSDLKNVKTEEDFGKTFYKGRFREIGS